MAVSHSFWAQWRSMSIGRACYNVASSFWLAFSFSFTKEINSPGTVHECVCVCACWTDSDKTLGPKQNNNNKRTEKEK